MDLPILNIDGSQAGAFNVPDGVLDIQPRADILHSVVEWQRANWRKYTANTKTRTELSGSGKKPWKQKGTGRARVGDRRSPIWRGGYTVHGPRAKSVTVGLPKKVRRLGLQMALADRAQSEVIKVLRGLEFSEAKTQQAKQVVDAAGGKKTLVVLGGAREAAGMLTVSEKSFRNLANVKVLLAEGVNVYDVLSHDTLIIAEEAMPKIIERLTVAGGVA